MVVKSAVRRFASFGSYRATLSWAALSAVLAAVVGCASDESTASTTSSSGTGGGAGAGGSTSSSGTGGNPNECTPAGALVDGATHTFCGEGFGSKPSAAPIHYDDFEAGPNGELLQGWDHYGNTEVVPVYGDQQAYAGDQSAFIDLPDGTYANGAFLSGLALTEVYFSYRVHVVDSGGYDEHPQLKFGRVTSAAIDEVHGSPNIGMTNVGTLQDGGCTWFNGGSGVPETFYGYQASVGDWVRIELYLKLSNPAGAPNGKRWAKYNHSGAMTYSGFPGGHFADPQGEGIDPNAYDGAELVTLTTDADDDVLNNVLLPFFTRTGQLISVWVDEVYVDSTQARVELGDAPSWGDCTQRSPQPASAWSDGAVTVTLNQGRLSGDAYAFVVTTAGQIIELGSIGAWP